MDSLVKIWGTPAAEEIYVLAGWRQWADAGSISSGLPQFLIEESNAQPIGEIRRDGFYLFQTPGTHHLLRPEIKLKDGHRVSLRKPRNDFFYIESNGKGLVIFLGEEPHLSIERYAAAFLDGVEALGARRVIAVSGVYGMMPYSRDREVSCIYSLPRLKQELQEYAVKFSNYEGGATVGACIADQAEGRGIEFIDFYAFVPAYDFTQFTTEIQGIRIEYDFRAWYELMRRINHMTGLGLDLSELEHRSYELNESIENEVRELDRRMGKFDVVDFLRQIDEEYEERPFMPMEDLWERELGDILDDFDE
jgi:proteasome assembly chaperone (PAC2) family protein